MSAPTPHLPPGTLIAGKYELEGLLGEGGMGAVYQATNLAIGRRVAIKILHASVADREDVRRRFELEARAAAVISHPGIVDVLDMGKTDEGDPFIVMEHLEGMTLRSVVKEFKGLTPPQAVGVMIPVLEALAAAHRAGVIHRDVKPANIFVCAKPQVVKLLDFGVSRFGESSGLTHTGTAVGTPRYMAPEQVLGEPDLGPEADLYSVGAVLYSLLSGRLPHGTGSDMALLARVLHDTPPALASLTPDLPAELCELVDSLLLKDRSRRPHDADAVREELRRIVPKSDLTAIFSAALRTSRAVALSPTPSGSLQSVARKGKPGPRASAPAAPTRASLPPPAPSKRGLIVGVVASALAVGGAAAWYLQQQASPPPLPAPVVEAPLVPAAAPPPASIIVTLSAEPAGAHITAGGVELTCNPCRLSGPEGSRQPVRVSAPGMAERSLDVLFDQARTETVALVALPPVAPVAEAAVDAGQPGRKKKAPRGLSVDEKNPYQ